MGGRARAPLIPLPIISEPFARVAMDIVRPLPRSKSGNKYILVMCDYATCYPEAVPLKTTDAVSVAEELLKVFCRVGFPNEILTDQGSNFMSQLLKEVYRLLRIHPIHTTPYHPQTDGLCEKFNQMLKNMLQKAVVEEGKDWEKLLHYLLFAYREVPQASTGFSPFELLYGRYVRGPLDLLRESWEADRKSDESVVSYVLPLQEKLAKMSELAQENLKYCTISGQVLQRREFSPGQKVLVLLPCLTSKLRAQWKGPYRVSRKIGPMTYEIEMPDKCKCHRIVHVNMLKAWHTVEPEASLLATEGKGKEEEEEEDGVIFWEGNPNDNDEPIVSFQLTTAQRKEMLALLREFRTTLSNRSGKTTIVEHTVDMGTSKPIRLRPGYLTHIVRWHAQSYRKCWSVV